MKPLFQLLVVLLSLTAVNVTAAENKAAWYRVEIIVFENKDSGALLTEAWPDDPGGPAGYDLVELSLDGKDKGWQVLPADDYELNNRAYALKKNRRYRLLLHTAWYQPAQENDQKKAAYLHSQLPIPYVDSGFPPGDKVMGPFNEELFGTFRLRISRFLHAELDLSYRIPQEVQYNEQKDALMESVKLAPGDNRFVFTSEPVTTVAQRTYRLHESRLIKSKEVNYFDHPLFGVLLYVTPLETD